MKSPSISTYSKILLAVFFIAGLTLVPQMSWAQEKAAELTDEEYKIYEDVKAEKDTAKKVDLIVQSLKEKPQSNLRKFFVPEFQQIIDGLNKENKWTQLIPLGEKFLSAVPNDKYTIKIMAFACEKTGNHKGVALYGEKIYASEPSPGLAADIAQAYQKSGNEEKYAQWREKASTSDPDSLQNLAEMTKKYVAGQNKAQASKTAKKIIGILPTAKKPANVDEATWKTIVSNAGAIAYAVVGSDAYESRRYAEAITNLDLSVKSFKRNEQAYFMLGMCYWQQNKLDAAMLNFAKVYLIKGSLSATAKKNLDQLATTTRRGAAAVTRIVEQAQQDLK
jgi:tetratricopeptide (TPR) repeat protein